MESVGRSQTVNNFTVSVSVLFLMKLLHSVIRNQPIKFCANFNTKSQFFHRWQHILDRGFANKVTMDVSALSTNGIVPDVIDTVPPEALNVNFEAGPVEMGNIFKISEVAPVPNITYDADPNKFYTLVHVGKCCLLIDNKSACTMHSYCVFPGTVIVYGPCESARFLSVANFCQCLVDSSSISQIQMPQVDPFRF